MDLKQLSEEIDYLKKRLANLEHKKLNETERFEVEVPDDLDDYYYVDELGTINLVGEVSSYYNFEKVYQRGLAFETEKQAEQHDKERVLLFKLHEWADWRNGDWYPYWEQSDDKFYIYYFHNTESFCVGSDWNCNTFNKLPYFKSEELAREFIEEFGDEIKEVLL